MSIEAVSQVSMFMLNHNQRYTSLAHFVALQPRHLVRVNTSLVPEGFITQAGAIYFWAPTPSDSDYDDYITAAREEFYRLVRECPNFAYIVLDLRNNIGGRLATFYDALLPILRCGGCKAGTLLTGRYKNGDKTEFIEKNNALILKFASGINIRSELCPIPVDVLDIVNAGKKVIILANEFTMSSSEIMAIMLLEKGAEIYGENFTAESVDGVMKFAPSKTGGLTNGCHVITEDSAEIKVPMYYFVDNSGKEYKDGIKLVNKIKPEFYK